VSIKEFCYPGHECTGTNNTFSNNLVFNNGQPIVLRHGRPRNTIAADPQFVEYRADGSGNYRLQPTSPAIAKGIALAAPSTEAGTGKRGRRQIDLGANIIQAPSSSHLCVPGKAKSGV
jgi:hypothetical protein